mmetsp:Transcript_24793/g.98438  ORF Transcript_24793/g.98438 Transcript_24793/m.98438 type:complete len:230 (+) Transcript_24793:94-783(+)
MVGAIPALVARIGVALLAAVVAFRYGVGIAAWRAANRLEKPSYDVLARIGPRMEVRAYAPYVVAEATMRGGESSMAALTGDGFRKCAGYIFGKRNTDRATGASRGMAMTAPVRIAQRDDATTRRDGSTVKVSFVMARNESLRTLPVPTDADVRLRQVPAHTAAFVAFAGGRPSETLVARKRAALDHAVKKHGFRPVRNAETLTYGYHDPFITPKFLRKNEVGCFIERVC